MELGLLYLSKSKSKFLILTEFFVHHASKLNVAKG